MKSSNKVWASCKSISNAICSEFDKQFSVSSCVEKYNHVQLYCIHLSHEGVNALITVQDRFSENAEKPFVYLDTIHVKSEYEGRGLARKVLESLKNLVNSGVFNYLNLKDWSSGFWEHVMPDYPFIRNKYSNDWIFG